MMIWQQSLYCFILKDSLYYKFWKRDRKKNRVLKLSLNRLKVGLYTKMEILYS